MKMPRRVSAETLDGLAEADPAAIRSRRDLRRIHRVMGTRAILMRAMRRQLASHASGQPLRILELGAGDGTLMLGVARACGRQWLPVELTLLDRQDLLSDATRAGYANAGWRVLAQLGDVHDWASSPTDSARSWDLIICTLFLHHFDGLPLRALLAAIGSRGARFFACEPHRGWLALVASHGVAVIGANAVTREDAVLSVHAGFREKELTQIWPQTTSDWTVDEYSAGLFTHCFSAVRSRPGRADISERARDKDATKPDHANPI